MIETFVVVGVVAGLAGLVAGWALLRRALRRAGDRIDTILGEELGPQPARQREDQENEHSTNA